MDEKLALFAAGLPTVGEPAVFFKFEAFFAAAPIAFAAIVMDFRALREAKLASFFMIVAAAEAAAVGASAPMEPRCTARAPPVETMDERGASPVESGTSSSPSQFRCMDNVIGRTGVLKTCITVATGMPVISFPLIFCNWSPGMTLPDRSKGPISPSTVRNRKMRTGRSLLKTAPNCTSSTTMSYEKTAAKGFVKTRVVGLSRFSKPVTAMCGKSAMSMSLTDFRISPGEILPNLSRGPNSGFPPSC
mmetsp:Transcript_18712/g.43495  ORF Transcript_18712/g.43495 Transcript_18712/m.43495 type:complete len:247 (+) Transcript_18712:88-828(+)